MKKIVFLLALVMGVMSTQAQTWQKVAGRWQYQFFRSDSAFVPPQDTLASAPIGALAVKTDVLYYKKNTGTWSPIISLAAQSLQQVTDVGNKTIDSIIVAGIRTNNILPDTLGDPDFEIQVLPDLQYQTLTGVPPGPVADSGLVGNTFNWIVNNKTVTNLKAVIQVGDLTDDANTPQFQRVDSNFDKLDAASIPYLYVPGNHDYDGGTPTNSRLVTVYDTWMGPARYSGKPYYGGNYLGSSANYYIKLDIGHRKFIFIGLEFIPRDAALTWAQGIMDANQDRETIIVTHGLITQWGEKSNDSSIATGGYGLTGNNGTKMWNKLIRKNKQIIMTLNGHYVGCCGGSAVVNNTNLGPFMQQRLTQTGDYGNVIHMIGYNHQSDSLGGAGHIMRLKFKPSAGTIDVSFFNARYEGNDPRMAGYSLYYPPVKVDGSLAVKGSFNVTGEATFDSTLKITGMPKYRPAIYGYNGQLDSIPAADSSYILVSQGRNKAPKYDTLPGNSNAYIKNQSAVAQAATFRIQGIGVMGTQSSYQATLGGSPISGAVTQGNGNFGFSIQRAGGINQSGPHLSFYHNGGSNFTGTPVPTQGAWELGNINWFGVSLDSVVRRSMYVRGRVETVGTNFVACAMRFDGFDNSGIDRTRMFISPAGNISIGGSTANTYRLEVTGAAFGGDSVRFSRLSGSNDVLTGTNNVGSFKKVLLGNGLSFNTQGDTLTSKNFFNADLTQTADRSHDAANHIITIDNAKTYNFISRGLNFQGKKRYNWLYMDATNSQDLSDFMWIRHVWRKGADNGDSARQHIVFNGNSGLRVGMENDISGQSSNVIFSAGTAILTGSDSVRIRAIPIAAADTIFVTGNFNAATKSNTVYKAPRLPYKIYVATLTQTGTGAPVATVLENTLGGTVVWTRNTTGDYTATLSGAFTANKTVIFAGPANDNSGPLPAACYRADANSITLKTLLPDGLGAFTPTDDALVEFSIEFRVYP